MNVKRYARGPLFWVLLVVLILVVLNGLWAGGSTFKSVSTSQVVADIDSGNVVTAVFHDKEQTVQLTLKTAVNGTLKEQASVAPDQELQLENRLDTVAAAQKLDRAKLYTVKVSHTSLLLEILLNALPILLLVGLMIFMLTQMQGGGSRVMNFGKSKAKLISKDTPKTTFADVAGADEAIEELIEIKEFLENPAKFQAIGAKIPKGVLLYGPPGTGKTLPARAVAGEAGVPFYSISGSDFVEMFVGVGASRVRDLFTQAKENSPSIIFVDEIDAVGRHRGAGIGGGNDEREQTLNQLLVEMDGFDVKTNVILIAATNRPDVLDPALLRPGRFDRQIGVDAPDLKGRQQILEVHGRGKPLAAGVNLEVLARKTPGFTGADLANVLNEAALLTARSHAQLIDNRALDEAVDRVMAGPQRRSRIMADKEKLITAYHEGGHALAAAAMRHTDPVTEITILPRGRALGYTMVLPLQDKYSVTRNELLDQLAYAMGGRVAEEIVFHDPTSGASNDIEKATVTARRMVTEYGMSAAIGSVKLGTAAGEPMMGRDGGSRDYSETIAETVDSEVRLLIEQAHTEAWTVINDNRDILDHLATELLEKETLDHEELAEIFKNVKKLPERPLWLSSKERPLSNLPAVKVPSKAPIDQGVVDGGVQSGVPSKPNRTPRPRKSPGIATA